MRVKIAEYPSLLVLTGDYAALQILRGRFRFRPDGYWRSLRYQLYVSTDGEKGWDGYIYPLNKKHGVWSVRRGRLDDVIDYCEEEGIECDLDDLFERPFQGLKATQVPDDLLVAAFKLDDHQRQCVASLLAAQVGRIKVTVSGGKTEIFLACAAMLRRRWPKTRVLYVVPSERLVKQVYERASTSLAGVRTSQYGGGVKDDTGELVVATAAMIHRNRATNVAWLKTFTAVLCDECHYAASDSWQVMLDNLRAVWRFAASDSHKENDDTGATVLLGLFGPILHTVTTGDMLELDRIAEPHVHFIRNKGWRGKFNGVPHVPEPDTRAWMYDADTGGFKKSTFLRYAPVLDEEGEEEWIFKKGQLCPSTQPGIYEVMPEGAAEPVNCAGKWLLLERAYDRAITSFKERNAEVVQAAVSFSAKGWPSLVVATRTLHAYILTTSLVKVLGEDKVQALMGDATSKERDIAFEWLKATPGSVLVSSLVKVGVSINEIRAGVVADHIADHEVFNQIVGRFIRKKEDTDKAHIVVFDDIQHNGMAQNSRALARWASKASGYVVHNYNSLQTCLHSLE